MSAWIVFLARLLLVLLFLPFSALDKILNFKDAVAQASQAAALSWAAKLLILAGFALEVSMSAAILSGIADRLAACIMALYCVLTALLWKQFWKAPGFRLKGRSAARDVFWDFLKNLSVAAAFCCWRLARTDRASQSYGHIHSGPPILMKPPPF